MTERLTSNNSPSPVKSETQMALENIDRQLELVDANENAIERTTERESLLEMRDDLVAETEKSKIVFPPAPNNPTANL